MGTLRSGQQVFVVREVTGESIEEADITRDEDWYEIKYGEGTAFVHSDFLASTPLYANGFIWTLIGLPMAFVTLALLAAPRSKRLTELASSMAGPFDALLFSVVLAAGLLLGVLGFLYSQLDDESIAAFLSASFTNLGSGLAGAAITFALFQSLLAKRSVTSEEVQELRREVVDSLRESSNRQQQAISALQNDIQRLRLDAQDQPPVRLFGKISLPSRFFH